MSPGICRYDGHNGSQAADYAKERYASLLLKQLFRSHHNHKGKVQLHVSDISTPSTHCTDDLDIRPGTLLRSAPRLRGSALCQGVIVCRLHAVLAQEPALRDCRGDMGARNPSPWAQHTSERESREAKAMSSAVKHAFKLLDDEILDRCRQEQGRDGSCALVILRIGLSSSVLLPALASQACLWNIAPDME